MPGGLTNTRNKEEGSDGDWIIAPPVPSLRKWLQLLQIERQLAKGVANKVHRWGHVPKCKFVSKLGVAVDLANPWMHSTGEPTTSDAGTCLDLDTEGITKIRVRCLLVALHVPDPIATDYQKPGAVLPVLAEVFKATRREPQVSLMDRPISSFDIYSVSLLKLSPPTCPSFTCTTVRLPYRNLCWPHKIHFSYRGKI